MKITNYYYMSNIVTPLSSSFMTYEQQYHQEQIDKQKQENNEMISKFNKSYPYVPFKILKKQKDNIRTEDGCIHYQNIITKNIYSYNFIDKKWMEHNPNYQTKLFNMFE